MIDRKGDFTLLVAQEYNFSSSCGRYHARDEQDVWTLKPHDSNTTELAGGDADNRKVRCGSKSEQNVKMLSHIFFLVADVEPALLCCLSYDYYVQLYIQVVYILYVL